MIEHDAGEGVCRASEGREGDEEVSIGGESIVEGEVEDEVGGGTFGVGVDFDGLGLMDRGDR